MIDKKQVLDWEHDPVTHMFKELIRQAVAFNTELLAKGNILHDSAIAEKYNYAIGYLDGLRFVLDAELIPEEDKE